MIAFALKNALGTIREASPTILILEGIICFEYVLIVSTVTIGVWTYLLMAIVIAPFAFLLDRRNRRTYIQQEVEKAKKALKH